MQVFAAPGDPDEPLPAQRAPWTIDRWVYLPLWDWYLFLEEAGRRDVESGRLLATVSGSADSDSADEMWLSADEGSRLDAFIDGLADEFSKGVDLSGPQAERDLGDYDSTVYAEMLRGRRSPP
jgi:hypothetical protein